MPFGDTDRRMPRNGCRRGHFGEDRDLVFCNRMGGYLMASHVSAGFRVLGEAGYHGFGSMTFATRPPV